MGEGKQLACENKILAIIPGAPHAIGINRSLENADSVPFAVFDWGLTHQYMNGDYQYIRRFNGKRKTTHVAKGASADSK